MYICNLVFGLDILMPGIFLGLNFRLVYFFGFAIGHVLNEQGTGYEHIFSWYECSISIELKMGHVI